MLALKSPVQSSRSIGVGVSTPFNNFSISYLEEDSKIIHYYTGFNNYEHFSLFMRMLDPPAVAQTAQRFCCLSAEDQVFLTLVKLPQNKDFEELALLFRISIGTIMSNVFQTWIMFIHSRVVLWPIWPKRQVIDDTMPQNFKRLFPTTRVIIDATEIPIMKPTNIDVQSQTFSSYKNRNTIKVMVGITPKGSCFLYK